MSDTEETALIAFRVGRLDSIEFRRSRVSQRQDKSRRGGGVDGGRRRRGAGFRMFRLLLVVGMQLVELLEVALRGELGDVRRIHGGDAALMLSHGGRWRWRWRPEERVTRCDSLRETSGRAGQLEGLKASLLLGAGREQRS